MVHASALLRDDAQARRAFLAASPEAHRSRWQESLSRLGNVMHKGAAPLAAIARVAVFGGGELPPRWPPGMFALGLLSEAEVSPASFARYGQLHRSVLAAVMETAEKAGCRAALSPLAA